MLATTSKERTIRLYDKRARIYDLIHHLQTLWADDFHRKEAVKYSLLQKRDLVLDVGAGTCLTAIKAVQSCHDIKVICCDLSQKMLEQGKKNIQKYGLEEYIKLEAADAENLPFASNTFDKIISAYGFGGISDPYAAINELVRVAKSNARITIADIADPPNHYPTFYKFINKQLVEPWVKYFWEFRNIDIGKLFKDNKIQIDLTRYYCNRLLVSVVLISGLVKK